MITRAGIGIGGAWMAGLIGALTGLPGAAAGENDTIQKLMDARAEAIVTVKYVMKIRMHGAGGAQENESEATGVMIDPAGMVLCSNSSVGGFVSIVKRMFGARIEGTPTDFRVVIGVDEDELEATLLIRDTDRDLVWVKINDVGERKLAYVDFAASESVAVGSKIFTVGRMGKLFDRVPFVGGGWIGGSTERPRDLWIPAAALRLGSPVFSANATPVGFVVLQLPDEDEAEGFNPFSFVMSGSFGGEQFQGVILPAADVVKATARAHELAKQRADEDAEPAGDDTDEGEDSDDEDD